MKKIIIADQAFSLVFWVSKFVHLSNTIQRRLLMIELMIVCSYNSIGIRRIDKSMLNFFSNIY